jgi:hypothetical protein
MFTVPKFTVPVGSTPKSSRATPLAAGEHALSLPLRSTAVTDTLYGVPVDSPVSLKVTVWLAGGLDVEEATGKKEDPGQGVLEVPK